MLLMHELLKQPQDDGAGSQADEGRQAGKQGALHRAESKAGL